MKKILVLILTTLVCSQASAARRNWREMPRWKTYFTAAEVDGTFLLYDLKADEYSAYNSARARTQFIPASTFKIFNSLVALELGTIRDAEEILSWDKVSRDSPAWNHDQNMREAIANSTVWFYQELARRAGEKRMQRFINQVGYGNKNISGGVDRFWLDGRLRISAEEQVKLLEKLYRNELPFSQRSIDITKDILINEKTDNYVMRGKTGYAHCFTFIQNCRLEGTDLGWWVGYVERADNVFFFALNLDVKKESDITARKQIVEAILRELKIVE
jgi:beta-lactamase class D